MTNAFDITGPSIFANDRTARGTKSGKSWSQVDAEVVKQRTAATGANPGTINGLSARADQQRKLRKARAR